MITKNEMMDYEKQLSNIIYDNWVHFDLFTWQWWLLLGLTIVPWFIWWKIVDKKNLQEILLFGFFVTIVATFLDIFGWNRQTWVYPTKLLPMCTPLLPFDFAIVPVSHMLVYQYFRSWKSFILVEILTALFFAFIAEPALVRFHIYKLIKWKHLYSVPFYFGKALLGKWLIEKTKRYER